MVGSVPVLHPEAQTADEILEVGAISNCATNPGYDPALATACALAAIADATADQGTRLRNVSSRIHRACT